MTVSIYLFVCSLSYLRNRISKLYRIFYIHVACGHGLVLAFAALHTYTLCTSGFGGMHHLSHSELNSAGGVSLSQQHHCQTSPALVTRRVHRWSRGCQGGICPATLRCWLVCVDVDVCRAEMWRAVACTLHVKPCSHTRHNNNVCRSVSLHWSHTLNVYVNISSMFSPACYYCLRRQISTKFSDYPTCGRGWLILRSLKGPCYYSRLNQLILIGRIAKIARLHLDS